MPLVLEESKSIIVVSLTVNEMKTLFTNKATADGLLTFVPTRVSITREGDGAGALRVTFEVDN